jgi:hypothetical protein
LSFSPNDPVPNVDPASYNNTEGGTFTITNLSAGTEYMITLEIMDADGTPVSSDTITVETPYEPLNIGSSLIDTTVGDINASPSGTYTATAITVDTVSQDIAGGSGTYIYRIAYRPTNDNSPTFDGNNMIESPWIDIGDSVTAQNVVATGLIANTTYYFIMYVSDSTATELAPVFTTPISQQTAQAAAPTVTTDSVEFTSGNILLTGTITGIGSSPIEYSGMCYSTTNPPTISDTVVANTTSEPNIIAEDTLLAGATYYVRAYATNEDGLTAYGSTSTVEA